MRRGVEVEAVVSRLDVGLDRLRRNLPAVVGYMEAELDVVTLFNRLIARKDSVVNDIAGGFLTEKVVAAESLTYAVDCEFVIFEIRIGELVGQLCNRFGGSGSTCCIFGFLRRSTLTGCEHCRSHQNCKQGGEIALHN